MREYSRELYSKLGSRRVATPYFRMVINPFDGEGQRYPDESIVPTGLVHLQTSSTFTVDNTAATSGMLTVLNWKVTDAVSGASSHATFLPPWGIGSPSVNSDYGAPQVAWRALDSIDRTLAAAIRVRVQGLPTSTFVPSGTLYFLQYQAGEAVGSFDTESECIQAVTARKGFSISVAEVAKLGAVHIPFLPQGPMSYVFSQSNSYPASGFPDSPTGSPVSSVIAPNGGLVVAGYGLQVGQILRFDYSHHVEYVPKVTSAGLIETKVELPSSEEREKIAQDSQETLNKIAGGTSAADIHILQGPGPSAMVPWNRRSHRNPLETLSSGLSTLDSMLSTISGLTSAATAIRGFF